MMVDLVVLNAHPPSYLQDLARPDHRRGLLAVSRRRLDRPARRRLRPAARPARRPTSCSCCAPPRGCTSPATAARSAGSSPRPSPTEAPPDDELEPSAPELRAPARSDSRVIRAVRRIGATAPDAAGAAPDATAPALRAAAAHRAGAAGAAVRRSTTASAGSPPDGDYEIRVRGDRVPPAPWANVIANPHGGFVVTERGGGFTWAENSYFFRLTPWHNDPVSDPVSEAIYLRDEDTRRALVRHAGADPARRRRTPSATARAAPSFEHEQRGIATHYPRHGRGRGVKLVAAAGDQPATAAAPAHADHLRGVDPRRRCASTPSTRCAPSSTARSGAILRAEHLRPAVRRLDRVPRDQRAGDGHTGEPARVPRPERHAPTRPRRSARRAALRGVTGAGIDPCAALQCVLELAPGETREIVILLGAAPRRGRGAAGCSREYRDVGARRGRARADGRAAGASGSRSITVRTPEPTFDAMLNRWTLYQALACRMWAPLGALPEQRRVRLPRPAPGRDGVRVRRAGARARAHPARGRAASSSRATCSTGGTRRAGAACAPGSPTTSPGCRTWSTTTSASTGDASVLDEYVPFLTHARSSSRTSTRSTTCPR